MAQAGIGGRRGQPLYLSVAKRLATEIAERRYPVGTRLPTESELCRQYNASRFTVREAIKQLQLMGLVTTRHGSGTEVLATRATSGRFSLSLGSVLDMLHSARSTRLVDVATELVPADEETAAILSCRPGDELLHVTATRVPVAVKGAAAKPLAMTDVWILGAYAGIRDAIHDSRTTLAELIEERHGVVTERIEQVVEPCIVTAAQSRVLDVPPRSLALRFTRKYVSDRGQVFEYATSVQAGEQSRLTMSIRATGAR